ncbi:hypothetical protein LNQ03_25450 [Klebsiella pneumoniae subsp. pneumoniae]|nr:hypothetical protein [Klebsiella pneumoniae subsp. pneumoniae]
MRNLLAGGFNGPVMPSPPPGRRFLGYWHGLPSRLPFTPDLAVLCTNARRNRDSLPSLRARAARPASSSLRSRNSTALLECAARYQMRLLGPNSLGLLAPWQGLNASFSYRCADPIAVNWPLSRSRPPSQYYP